MYNEGNSSSVAVLEQSHVPLLPNLHFFVGFMRQQQHNVFSASGCWWLWRRLI